MGIKIEVTQPDGGTEVHDGDDERDTPDAAEPEKPEADADPAPEAEAAPDEEPADEVTVSIGDEAPPEEENPSTAAFARMRIETRELRKKIRDYEAREQIAPAKPKPVVGPKPKLEDHDYDTDKYETALESWYKQKDAVESARRQQQQQADEHQRTWQSKLDGYAKAKTDLKVRDYEDAEATVQEALNVTQQGIVLQGAENPALVVYALGKNPKKAKELAAITDPVKFAFAIAKLEAQLKVTSTRKPPAPERGIPVGNAPISGTTDSVLERLRVDAERTGDMTKVIAYRRQQRSKQASAR